MGMPHLERHVLLVSLSELRPGQRLHVVLYLPGGKGARAGGRYPGTGDALNRAEIHLDTRWVRFKRSIEIDE